MLSKFLDFIAFINFIFYGSYWYIAWGIVLLLFAVVAAVEVPKLVKSFKEAKERNKTK